MEEVHQKRIEEEEELPMMMKKKTKEEREEKEQEQQVKEKELKLLRPLLGHRDDSFRSGTLRHWEDVCNQEGTCLDQRTP